MIRHTTSPIWCMALLLAACGDEATSEVQPPPIAPVEATAKAGDPAAPGVAAVAAPQPKESSSSILFTPREEAAAAVSARPPDIIALELSDTGDPSIIRGFDHPSAVLYDHQADLYLVSNLGSGEGASGSGYIARVDVKGVLKEPRWIDGASSRARLKTPRGLAIVRGRLYVADGALVRVYDRKTGARRGTIKIPGATQLSGLAHGGSGSLLVSDAGYRADGRPSGTDAVYRVNRAGRVSALFRSSVLGHPVGVAYIGQTVWIATGGSGRLHGLKTNGTLINGPKLDEGRLAGIVEIGPRDVIVTSQVAQGVYRGALNGTFAYLGGQISSPGHPGWDPKRRRLLVPSRETGEVHILDLPVKEPRRRSRR
jgi:hypothetical protein